ncbi:hypothetical protein N656DRAFT_768740 [Canariomyces notabilis]|uniref:Uncharacterized protein n=1 Tax=Canariomyces notabilis TaxID=2074819 RepID=A0AAN6TD63_9PEZI|nr:hypothetical protein N656DRAFT_768740 [Canariomyces arenarius]
MVELLEKGMIFQENTDDGLAEELSRAQTELKRLRDKWAADLTSLREKCDEEKAAQKRSFDGQKATLQAESQAREAQLKRELEEKVKEVKEVERQLEASTRKLDRVKKDKERVDRLCTEMSRAQDTLIEEKQELTQERDDAEAKAQGLEYNVSDLKRSLQEAKDDQEAKARSIASLTSERDKASGELADLRQTVVPENRRLAATNSSLLGTLKETEEKLKDEKINAEKANRETVSGELKRVKELMGKELSDKEKNVNDLHIKIAGLNGRLESATAKNTDLEAAIHDLKQSLAREKEERQDADRENRRLKLKITELNGRADTAEERVSSLEADLSAAESRVESYRDALDSERARCIKLDDELKREKSNLVEAQAQLEAFQIVTKDKTTKLEGELETARKEAGDNVKLYSDTKAALEKTQRDLSEARLESDKQGRLRRAEIERTKKLQAELDRAIQREREYDPDRLYQQLDAEREAHRCCKATLETKECTIRQHLGTIADLEIKYQKAHNAEVALGTQVLALAVQVKQLGASLTEERNNRVRIQGLLDSEVAEHNLTRQALSSETTRANNETIRANNEATRANTYGSKLDFANAQLSREMAKLRQANIDLSSAWSNLNWANSQLSSKNQELQHVKIQLSNQNAQIRSLQSAAKHTNCVTLSSVNTLIGSYERLYDFAERKGVRRQTWTLYKAHYPNGFSFRNGKYEIDFRGEIF